ncbi:replication protein A 32 kDa subunit-like [Zophobas morio]|jgi:replication factor A2|uniref:replication protein A 32 kDa subunit-like n=1 Tax=Zophobas morio TaxID=2755281 RepID=UPI003082ABA5
MNFPQSLQGGFITSNLGGRSSFDSPIKKGHIEGTIDCCLPVTIKQMLFSANNEQDEVRIDGIIPSQLTFVGMIRSLTRNSTNIDYLIEDSTGSINVRMWSEGDDIGVYGSKGNEFVEGSYVRVFGILRNFLEKWSFNAHHFALVTDYNEITFHLLEVIHTHLLNVRGSVITNEGLTSGNNELLNRGGYFPQQSQYYEQFETELQKQVFECVCRGKEQVGVPIQSIIQELRHSNEYEIRNAVEFLSNEGHIYSTIDDEHFKPTDEEIY